MRKQWILFVSTFIALGALATTNNLSMIKANASKLSVDRVLYNSASKTVTVFGSSALPGKVKLSIADGHKSITARTNKTMHYKASITVHGWPKLLLTSGNYRLLLPARRYTTPQLKLYRKRPSITKLASLTDGHSLTAMEVIAPKGSVVSFYSNNHRIRLVKIKHQKTNITLETDENVNSKEISVRVKSSNKKTAPKKSIPTNWTWLAGAKQ